MERVIDFVKGSEALSRIQESLRTEWVGTGML